MMYLNIKEQKVEIVETFGEPGRIYKDIVPLCSDKVMNTVFHGVTIPDQIELSYLFSKSGVWRVLVGRYCVAAVWFTNLRKASSEIHFMINPEKYGLDYVFLGKKVLNRLMETKPDQVFYSYMPAFNSTILKFALKLGFEVKGVIKNGALDPDGNKSDMDLIVYSTSKKDKES